MKRGKGQDKRPGVKIGHLHISSNGEMNRGWLLCFIKKKKIRRKGICLVDVLSDVGKGVPLQAHVEASLPP